MSDILTGYSAGIGCDNVEQDCNGKCLKPMKHSVLKAARDSKDGQVHNVKVDISLSLKD